MPFWKALVILVIISVLGYGLYGLAQDNQQMDAQLDELESQVDRLESENRNLERDIEYYEKPANLLKQVKENFNYRQEGEGMFIIVPSD